MAASEPWELYKGMVIYVQQLFWAVDIIQQKLELIEWLAAKTQAKGKNILRQKSLLQTRFNKCSVWMHSLFSQVDMTNMSKRVCFSGRLKSLGFPTNKR